MDPKVIIELEKIVGKEFVSTRKDVLTAYSVSASTSYEPVMPDAVVRPGNTGEIAQIMRVANKNEIPVIPRSGGSSLQGEVIPKDGGLVIEMMRLNSISLYKELRSVTVGAGVTYGMLDKFLKQDDLWVPFYPGSSLSATIAGNVAVNGAGFGSSKFGCIAEFVLGLEVVLSDGRIIQTGSEANPNAPGPFLRYSFGPDLTGLFIGSLGSFGIITKVSLKTHRRMHQYDYNTFGFEVADQAEKFLIELKQNDVSSLWAVIYEGGILDLFLEMIGEEFGVPKYDWPKYTVSLVLGSLRKDQLQSDIEMAKRLCERTGGHEIGIKELPEGEWNNRMKILARSSYVHRWHWRILYHHQTPSNWHRTIEEVWSVMEEYNILGHTAGFQSGHASYNYYPQLFYDPQDKEEEQKVREAHRELARRLFKTGAVPFKLAPYWIDGVEEMDNYLGLVKALKESLDPKGIMNPGVLGGN
ncbi:MAG: FAD-binding oxidoreductase [Candidatus Thorarchaeota archaeon]